MENNKFGLRLRELRRQAGLSQRELASKIGVNFSYLSKIENGAMPPPSEKIILRLAEALNTDKDELITLAGRIPPDIAQLLKNRETLQLLRSQRSDKKKVKASSKLRGAIPMNLKTIARVAIAIILVAAIGTSLWFASPIPVKAFSIASSVANSPISGNSTYLLGEKITIPSDIGFTGIEYKDLNAISLNITGPESFGKTLPVAAGSYTYTDIPGSLEVTVTWGTGVGPYGYKYGYGYAGGSGNISYNIQWTPPYTLTTTPTPPPAALPAAPDFHFDTGGGTGIDIPGGVRSTINASLDWPQGLAYDSANQTLYILVPGNYFDGTNYKDVIIKTDTSGNYLGWMPAPGNNYNTEGLTFIGSTLYAAYNEWNATTYVINGKVAKYSTTSGNWTDVTGMTTLNPIGGLASDNTSLFIAYRDQLTIGKRDPVSGAQITSFDLSAILGGGAGGMGPGMGPAIWGFDALAYSDSELYVAKGEKLVVLNATTGAKTADYTTGMWDIRGLSFVSETYSGTAYDILYLAVTQWPGKIYRASKAGIGAAQVENTPIGSYTTLFRVVADGTPYSASSNFTLGKLTTAPAVTISAPTQGFAYGAGAENITVSGSINDPSIATVTVGIALPEVTAFQADMENATQTTGNWTHSAVTGQSPWMMYSTEDLWHRSGKRSGDTKPGAGTVGYAWRYANSTTNNYVSSDSWKANAGAVRTKSAIAIGADNTLSFWTWYDGELDFWPDRKVVEVSTDNTTWTAVAWLAKFWPPFKPPDITQAQYDTLVSVPERTWTQVQVSLADYASQSIYLRFRFDTMDDWSNNFEGWYIDDVTITGAGFQGTSVAVDANREFSANFTLAEGSNTISVTAARTNYAPLLTGSANVSGSLDTVRPIVRLNPVTSPTNAQYQVISGNVTEANFDRLEIRKDSLLKWSTTVLGTGNTFSQSILLNEGSNSIMVKVTDKVGLTANTTATIQLDTTGPVFNAVFPGSANRTYDVAYKTGEISARVGDFFFIALSITDNASAVASVRLVTPGRGGGDGPTAKLKSALPEAVIDNWGFSANTKEQMNYVMPFQLHSGAPAGDYSWTVIATDTAGNSSNTTVVTRVVTTLEAFNIYLMPGWNLVSTPVIPTTANITTLTTSANATGLFERVWYYNAAAANISAAWIYYDPSVGGQLTTIDTGKGYWFKMKPLTHTANTSAVDSFTEAGKVSGPMATGLPNTPAPVKVTILGQVLEAGATVPPTYTVYAGWNLVGLHSEIVRPVSTALQSVTVPTQKWGSLLQYLNYISFPMEQGVMPQIDLGRFDRLISTDNMEPGRGFWIYMVEAGTIVP